MSAFDRLLEQIDAFIKKYYKNEMWKGLVFWLSFMLSAWLVVSVLEYFGRFSSVIRGTLFFLFVVGNIYLAGRYFILPLLRLFEFGKRINREQAAQIIGKFFPNVSDRLLNTLQLNQMVNKNDRSYELLAASVSQRSQELTVVPFVDAVRQEELKRYLKFGLPIAGVFILVLAVAPNWIIEGSSQVINYSKAQVAPFEFNLVSSSDPIKEGENAKVRVRITGVYIPENCYVVSSRGKFLLSKIRRNEMEFEFDNLKQDLVFHFESEGFSSDEYKIPVIGKSSLGSVRAELIFPKYLNRKNEVASNIANIELPEGTKVKWSIHSKNTKEVRTIWNGKRRSFNSGELAFEETYQSSGDLKFVLKNKYTSGIDSSEIRIQVIKDAYPTIVVSEAVDSVRKTVRSFEGIVSDDHGLQSLTFHYSITRKNGKKISHAMRVQAVKGVNDRFLFSVDFGREDLEIEDKLSYYFTVSDNDGVNGSKSTNSQSFVYKLPTLNELNDEREETQKEAINDLQRILKRTEDFQKDIKDLKKNLNNNSKSDFKSLEQIQQLQQEQETLKKDMQSIMEEMESSNEQKEELTKQDEELLKQQELLEELMKEVMDEELEKLLKELEELMKKNDKQGMNKESEKLEQSSEQKKNQLDRTLEMLKKLQVNEKIDGLEEELKELAEKQEELKVDIEKGKISEEKALEEQKEIQEKFEELKKELEEVDKLNKELARPLNLSDYKEVEEAIDQELNESKEKISSGKPSKAGQNQKSAANKMKEMADQLNAEQESSNKKNNEEDMASIRMLLENLMSLSFNQESNMNGFARVRSNDPSYRRLGRKQRSIIDDTKVVEDSLMALAKRQPKIAGFIEKELAEIKANYGLIVDDVDEHQVWSLNQHQQLVMTSFNNLALMLNESLQSMQQQAQSQQKGSGQCENPGGSGSGKPSAGEGDMDSQDMKEMLKKQLEQMKKGPMPGGKEPGNKPGNEGEGSQGMPGLGNKEIAKMAAQQTAIRQKLEQMRNELNKEGQGKGNQLNKLIDELEKQERDLINKKFSPDMIRRQQDILTRLLESEKAIRERGFEEKRESISGKNQNVGNLIRFDEYNKKRLGQIELLRAVDPVLTPYYKSKASQYFNLPE